MTALRAAREYRAALFTAVLLLAAIGGAQLFVRAERTLPEPAGFALTPSGGDVGRLVPVTVTFPSAPGSRDAAKLLTIEPSTAGSYTWVTARTLLFQPDFPGLLRGGRYTVSVPALPEAGVPQTVTRTFTVTGKLTVQQVIPSDGDVEVPLDAQILVQFSRSVAPLTTLAERRDDPPLRFEPALHGKGEWLNTSIYRFIPDDLAPSTTYRIVVPKGLSSAADGVLESDHASTFTTVTPGVASFVPQDNTQFAAPTQPVTITFNQPIDRASAPAIGVRRPDGAPVAGTISWSEHDTVATFTPSSRLLPGTRYVATVDAGIRGAGGGVSTRSYSASFVTAPPPSIRSTAPGDREQNAGRYGVSITFATPMDPETLKGKIAISGFTEKDLEGRVDVQEQFVSVGVELRPSTTYTVRWAAGATDRYGTPLGAAEFAFTTGALPSSVSFALPGWSPTVTYAASAEPILWFQATNTASVPFRMWRLDDRTGSDLMHDYGRRSQGFTPSGNPLRSWDQAVDAAKDETVLGTTSLSGGGPLAKGYYFVRSGSDYASQFVFAVIDTELVTKVSMNELLVWAIDHDSGDPVAGAKVDVYGPSPGSSTIVTDAHGIARTSIPVPYPETQVDRSYWVILADGTRFGVASTRWPSLGAWQYGLPGEYNARHWVGQVYTDRPLYKPGETVDFKAIVRADDDASYTVPGATPDLELVVRNPRAQEVQRRPLTLSSFGSFAGSFGIAEDTPLGSYQITIEQASGPTRGMWVAGNTFLVAEFRKPEFSVTTAAGRTSYVDGEAIDVRTSAAYFFGGPVADAKLDYSVVASPYALSVKGFERYSFTDYDPWLAAIARAPVRASGTTRTGADGVAAYAIPAVLNASEGAQRFTLSASILDSNGQAVGASTTVTVHPASLVAGIRPGDYIASEGQRTGIDLVSVDTDGAIVGARPIVVKVYEREWITTKEELPGGGRRYRSEPRDTLLATLQATTRADGTATLEYTPTRGGLLRLVAEISDDRGRVARSASYLWTAGSAFALWQVTNDDTIKLVADKDRYEVGETAEVLVPSPFAGATGLVTVERGKIMSAEVREFASNSERVRIPITSAAVPDVFASVVLYRPPTADDPVPRYKVGYVELPVSTTTRELRVAIAPDRSEAKPGDAVRYDIRVTDATGRPVRAELSVAVVDKAILTLQEERGPDGLHAFWFERGLAVTTGSTLSVSVDRYNDAVAEAARQGKGGSGGALTSDTRKDFRSTAYWTAQLVTGDDGRATVSVTMPDDLTTWRMAVRAISGDTLVGEGTNELVSTKPLLVRPALPRFVRVGDHFALRALVLNHTSAPADVTVRLDVDGIDVQDTAPRRVTIAGGASATVSWAAVVANEGTVRVVFDARAAGDLSDRVAIELPATLDVTPETMSTGGIVTNDSQVEAIYLPPYADRRYGSLRIQVASALVGAMKDELAFYPTHEIEGAEYVASRLMATIAVRRTEASAAASTASYDRAIARDVAGLIGRQRGDGGWAWCDFPSCATDPNVTGWVLLALGEARRDGMSIGLETLDHASSYVMREIVTPSDVLHPASPDRKAFLLAGLASASAKGEARVPATALFEQFRSGLSNWGRAYLLLAFTSLGLGDGPNARALLDDLAAATLPSANGNHWEDTPERRAPFMTNTATTGLVALALAHAAPDHALLPQTVRWLVVARASRDWKTSVDRALGMLGLSAYAVSTGELAGSFRYQVTLDERQILAGLASPQQPAKAERTVPLTDLELGAMDRLAFERELGGPGRLYYTVDLRYVTPAREVEALNRGFGVTRTYTTLDDPKTPITTAKLGDVVRVTMTILATTDRSYVRVEDLLPAGLEAVDVRLATVDPGLRAKLEAEQAAAVEKHETTFTAPWYRWYWSPWQSSEIRDDRVVLEADRLPKGVYEYVYYARATTVGDFFVAPAHAEETYFPEVFGRGDSARFSVGE